MARACALRLVHTGQHTSLGGGFVGHEGLQETLPDLLLAVTARISCGGQNGTGFFIAPGTLLTAAHVVQQDDCTVHWRGEARPATVKLRLPEELPAPAQRGNYPLPDLAVVETPHFSGHPFADLDTEPAGTRSGPDELSTVGFTSRFDGTRRLQDRADYRALGTTVLDGVELLQVSEGVMLPGMSGAPVLNNRTGRICAVIKRTADDRRLAAGGWSVSLPPLIERDPTLATLVNRGGRWRAARRRSLFPELDDFLTMPRRMPKPDEADSPSWPLRPEYGVVPFHGRDQWQRDLIGWCESAEDVSLRLVTGQGGAGKTRSALELLDDRRRAGWIAGSLSVAVTHQSPERLAYMIKRLAGLGEPTLVVIDYAESLSNLGTLLDLCGQYFKESSTLRLLLLARRAGAWWTKALREQLADRAMRRQADDSRHVLGLAGLADTDEDWQAEFTFALEAFAKRHGVPVPTQVALETRPDDHPPVLQVHAAALLALLKARENPLVEHTVTPGTEVIKELLDRERSYWTRSGKHRLNQEVGPSERDLAVALSVLVGADDQESAVELISRVFGFRTGTSLEIAEWLSSLYPVGQADGSRYWAPLRPDLIGEHHVVVEFGRQPFMADKALTGLDEHGLRHAFTVLARAAQHSPKEAQALAVTLLSKRQLERLPVAVRLAPSVGRGLGSVIKEVLAETSLDEGVIEAVVEAMPVSSVELTPVSSFLMGHLDASELAPWLLLEYGADLISTGSLTAGVAALRDAVVQYEDLERENPGSQTDDIVVAYGALGVGLAHSGRAEEAVAYCKKAVGICRTVEEPGRSGVVALLSAAEALLVAGRAAEAENLVNQAIAAMRTLPPEVIDNAAMVSAALATKAQILVVMGQVERAQRAANAAHESLPPEALENRDLYGLELGAVASARAITAFAAEDTRNTERLLNEALAHLTWLNGQGIRALNTALCFLLVARAHIAFEAGETKRAREMSRSAAAIAAQHREAGYGRAGFLLVHALASLRDMGAALPESLLELLPRPEDLVAGEGHELEPTADFALRLATKTVEIAEGVSPDTVSQVLVRHRLAKECADTDRQRAVELAREALALAEPGDSQDGVTLPGEAADLLHDLSLWVVPQENAEKTHWREAHEYARRTVELRQSLADTDPGASQVAALVDELIGLGGIEAALEEQENALAAYARAATAGAELLETRPGRLLSPVARAMSQQMVTLVELERVVEALGVSERLQARHLRFRGVLAETSPGLISTTLVQHGQLLVLRERLTEAIEFVADGVEREFFGAPEVCAPLVHAPHPMLYLVELRIRAGDTEGALRDLARVGEVCGKIDDPARVLARGLRLQGEAMRLEGRLDDAVVPLGQALSSYRTLAGPAAGNPQVLDSLGALAYTHVAAGHQEIALPLCDELVAAYEGSADNKGFAAEWRLRRSYVRSFLGDLPLALDDSVVAEAEFRTTGAQWGVRDALIAQALHRLAAGCPMDALEAADEAEALGHELLRADAETNALWLVHAMNVRIAILRELGTTSTEDESLANALRIRYALEMDGLMELIQRAVGSCRMTYD
ncbi:trypsin-like peptidase domain-containing protein [Streptomyces sp. NPDC002402]